MTNKSPGNAALDELVQALTELCLDCGRPSFRELATISRQVKAHYKERLPKLQELSVTALSDILGRRRKGPPSWSWVATYVLSCQQYAYESGARQQDPGPSTLPAWRALHRAALEAAPPPLSAPVVHVSEGERSLVNAVAVVGEEPATDPGHRSPWASPAPPMSEDALRQWLDSLPETGVPGDGQESMTERRYREMFGPHGLDLLRAAESGDEDAACRLGLLLLCEGRPVEGLAWLESAAAAGDVVAEALVNAAPGWRTELAAELAYELTLPGYGCDPVAWRKSDGLTGAETYYRSASHSGHPGATYHLALMLQARGDEASALYLFGQADALGHPEAREALERLQAHLASS